MLRNQHLQQVHFIQKTVRLENEAFPTNFETVRMMFKYKTSNRTLCFRSALHSLCEQGFPLEGSQIFFWDNVKQLFVYVGCFPSQTPMDLAYELFQQNIIYLRYRRIMKRIEPLKERKVQKAAKRIKQRTIQEAIDKVSIWQRLYQKTDSNGKKLYTMEAAAREIGVAKKTLDDYKNQIKLGEKFNFDFNKHSFERIGVLRAYIKCALANGLQPPTSPPVSVSPVPPIPDGTPQIMEIQSKQNTNYDSKSDSEASEADGYLFHQTHSWCDSD